MEELYKVNQAAIILKVHPLTIRRYIKEGRLKALRVGGNIRIDINDLRGFTQNFIPNTNQTQAQANPMVREFSLDDSLFKVKARGLNMNKPEE